MVQRFVFRVQCSGFSVQGSLFSVRATALLQSLKLIPEFPIPNSQFQIPNPESPIPNPQSRIPNPQCVIANPKRFASVETSPCARRVLLIPITVTDFLRPARRLCRPRR
ncbi:hypothetical protein CRI94_06240 [Longibacter salinarum]|uniref:Uncharacterized protein n=1 Tax=Longibacter salinarum TaxID=1850348 RepID=A0A2A8D1U7_9BACT|nr:hypothetical protein CRI94_06240 [Longibacter salinarum]